MLVSPSRYSACESLNRLGTSHDRADGDYCEFDGSYEDPHPATWTDETPSCWHVPCPMSLGRSRSPFSDLSVPYASPASSCVRPAPIGSRSRGAGASDQRHYGGRGADTAQPCRAICSGVSVETLGNISYDRSAKFTHYFICTLICPSVEGKVRVKEKRRRRREKNREKYGDKHRMAFTCAFCKFRTFEDKDIEKHFGSTYHRETLDYIRRQTKFDDRVISFLHDCMVQKFRKTVSALCKLRTLSDQKTNQKLMEGVTEDDYMRKVEVVHCMACDTHIAAVFASVQHHLNSPVHLKSKVMYKERLKRESVLTAKAIINNDGVKVRYEKYMKGEDPFVTDAGEETSSDSSEQERPDEPEDDTG
uniref:DBIRD complex subunit ZNF326 n=1 Tax=Electrophorus electricus TaxID=8005 RepID=A0A4W4FLT0_ELEEL